MSSQETDEDDKQVGVYKILRTRGRDHTFQGLVWWENELRKDATWEDVDNNLDNNYAFNEYIANNKNLLKKTRNELVHRNVKVILNEINLTGMPENLKRLSCPKTTIPRSSPHGITCLSSPQNMVCLSFPPTISGHSCSREENRPQCLKVSVPPSISETFSTQSCSEGKINQFVPKSVDSSLGSERIRHSRIPEKTIVVSSSESDYSNDEEETENGSKIGYFKEKRLKVRAMGKIINHRYTKSKIYYHALLKDGQNVWITWSQMPFDYLEFHMEYMIAKEKRLSCSSLLLTSS